MRKLLLKIANPRWLLERLSGVRDEGHVSHKSLGLKQEVDEWMCTFKVPWE